MPAETKDKMIRFRWFSSRTRNDLMSIYQNKVIRGEIEFDDLQHNVLKRLNALSRVLVQNEAILRDQFQLELNERVLSDKKIPSTVTSTSQVHHIDHHNEKVQSGNPQIPSHSERTDCLNTPLPKSNLKLRGLYIHGTVGCGKSMLMDLFYHNCSLKLKRRVHFHKFMLEIHQRIFNFKQNLLKSEGRDVNLNLSSERDALTQVARQVAAEAQLLCFDEFQVTDICDAMILRRLFSELWGLGTVLVATSNRPVSDLYLGGLNREYFLPFLNQMQSECVEWDMGSERDYRLRSKETETLHYSPSSPPCTLPASSLQIHPPHPHPLSPSDWSMWTRFLSPPLSLLPPHLHSLPLSVQSDQTSQGPVSYPVMMGRRVWVQRVREVGLEGGVVVRAGWSSFPSLCEGDLGAADYQSLARHLHILFIQDVPSQSVLAHDRARRLLTLIDELYEAGVRVIWSSQREEGEREGEGEGGRGRRAHLIFDYDQSISDQTETNNTPTSPSPLSSPTSNQISDTRTHCISLSTPSPSPLSSSSSSSPDSPPTSLSVEIGRGELAAVKDLAFAYRRASSRLREMLGEEWGRRWGRRMGLDKSDSPPQKEL